MTKHTRDYDACVKEISGLSLENKSREARMRAVVGVLWGHLAEAAVAWLGFYVIAEHRDGMILARCKPRPACSPIGLHGVCGRGWSERRTQIVPDVHALGDAHVVCDPSNLSEIVVPLMNGDGTCDAVLDLDSRELDAFAEADAEGLTRVLRAAHLTAPT
jgi:putative methionine-R-sulfoxide reductase with GAF domain